MPLALWIGDGGHFFVDTFSGCDVQVSEFIGTCFVPPLPPA